MGESNVGGPYRGRQCGVPCAGGTLYRDHVCLLPSDEDLTAAGFNNDNAFQCGVVGCWVCGTCGLNWNRRPSGWGGKWELATPTPKEAEHE